MPISNGAFNELLYTRWVKQRAADVDKWSGGRLGYVHIQSMGDDSFVLFTRTSWVNTMIAKELSSTLASMAEAACTRI